MGFLDFFKNIFNNRQSDQSTVTHKLIVTNVTEENNRQQIVDFIKQNTSLTPCTYSSDELEKYGYQKLSATVGPVFSQLPSILGTSIAANSYQIRLPQGFTINDLMKLKSNNEMTTILKEGGKGAIKGSASLVSNAPAAVVMGVFTVLSVITAQYFLKEINNNMVIIKNRLNNIDFFLKAEKQSALLANIDFMQEIQRDYEHIAQNSSYQQAILTNVLDVKKKANADIKFYSNMIMRLLLQINGKKDKEDKISEDLAQVYENIENLKFSTMLYMCSSIMQIIYSDNMGNSEYIDTISEDMGDAKAIFESILSECLEIYQTNKELMKSRVFVGNNIKRGKFNPDDYFNPELIAEDKNVFCGKFIDTMRQIQLMSNNNAEYIVYGGDLYTKIG